MYTLVGKKAPDFNATAVQGSRIIENFSLSQFEGKKYVVLFFYPMDFTFVCPTELHAFQEKLEEFEKRDVQLIGCSVDSQFSHFAWLSQDRKDGGIKGVEYPIVSDFSKVISQNFGVLAGEEDIDDEGNLVYEGDPVAYRGLFLIDKEGIVRHMLINDMALGRSVDETLRMVDALQHYEKYGEVCPANWSEGKEAIKEDHDSVADYLAHH
ncbi:MAG: peroxiredoxin [Porphyromonas sp.]|nr:peroxiredoxin [Porphyromonas sp.]